MCVSYWFCFSGESDKCKVLWTRGSLQHTSVIQEAVPIQRDIVSWADTQRALQGPFHTKSSSLLCVPGVCCLYIPMQQHVCVCVCVCLISTLHMVNGSTLGWYLSLCMSKPDPKLECGCCSRVASELIGGRWQAAHRSGGAQAGLTVVTEGPVPQMTPQPTQAAVPALSLNWHCSVPSASWQVLQGGQGLPKWTVQDSRASFL